jgi:DNA-binding transcriptional LysR family regulator
LRSTDHVESFFLAHFVSASILSATRAGPSSNNRLQGQLVFNGIFEVLDAAVAGFGLAYVPEDLALPHFAKGGLTRVLEDCCTPWPGYHLYYPISRQSSAAFDLLVDALRHRQ